VENTTEQPRITSIEDAVGLLIEPQEAPEEELEEASAELEDDSDLEETDDSEEEVAEFDDSEEEEVEEDDEGTDDAGSEEPELYAVKVDGVEEMVTLETLKQGYSGQKYVQKGMQEAAAAKKQAEQVYEYLSAERQKVVDLVQQIQSGQFLQPPTRPSKEMLDRDPLGYMEKHAAYEEAQRNYEEQLGQMQQLMAQQAEAQERVRQEYLKQELNQLRALMPEFGDAEKAPKLKQRLVQGAKDYFGYEPNDLNNVYDHRAIRVLDAAIKWMNLESSKDKVQKKVAKAKPVLRPGAKKFDDGKTKIRQRRKAKLGQTGRIEDAVSLILNQ
jgi:hypothetical protein